MKEARSLLISRACDSAKRIRTTVSSYNGSNSEVRNGHHHARAVFIGTETTSSQMCHALASCLISAQPLPAYRPAADDNSLIGCTKPRPDRWLVAAQCPFRWQLMSILVLVWMRSFIEPDVLNVRQYHSDLSDQSALEIRVKIWIRLRVALF